MSISHVCTLGAFQTVTLIKYRDINGKRYREDIARWHEDMNFLFKW